MDSPEILKNIIRRERKARKMAEQWLEKKSLELYLANEQLKGMNESLEEKILARTKEIEASKEALLVEKDKAEAATRAKSEFLSNMSHEIRTPLNAIMGLTDLILQDSRDDVAVEYSSSIKYSAENLLHIINEILDFSKIEAGKITFEEIDFDLGKVCKGLEDTFRHKAEEKSLVFVIEQDRRIPQIVNGDPVKLNQILINLIGNAFKFTDEGFVRVSLKWEKQEGKHFDLLVRVEDSGIGIPKAKQGDIFQTFTQANNSTTRLYGGTGLGLAITRKLVELQRGKIWLESEEGVGTSFSFRIPMREGIPIETKEIANNKRKEASLKDLKVLVVEDIAVNRFLMKQILKRKQIRGDFAVNGREAIEILSEQTYDLVLMDLHMPEIDGWKATEIIRSQDSPVLNHEVPIIALTADAFEETKSKVLKAGMDGFLPKPVDIHQLYDTLIDLFAD
ncbi:MAG: ATP-binding protein [Bacteroidota bacterium]